MVDPVTLAGISVAAAAGGGLVLRNVFARAAMNNVLRIAQPSIDSFRENKINLMTVDLMSPLQGKAREGVTLLQRVLSESQALTDTFRKEFDKLKIPKLNDIPSDRLLSRDMTEVGQAVMAAYAGVVAYKFTSVYRDHVLHRMAEAAGQNLPPEVISSAFDSHVIATLDNLGVTDHVMQAVQALSDHVPGAVSETAFTLIHEAMLPGVMTAVSTIISEGKLAFNGGTSLGDSLAYGVVPAAGIFAAVKAGMMIDVASGGMTFGLGTLSGLAAGIFGRKAYLNAAIDRDVNTLEPHANRVRRQKSSSIKAINTVIVSQFRGLPQLVDACPKITDEKHLKKLFSELADAVEADFAYARKDITDAYRARTKSLPGANAWQAVLLINPRRRAEAAYREVANARIEELRAAKLATTQMMAQDPAQAVAMILTRPQFRARRFEGKLVNLVDDLRPLVEAYDKSLKIWGEGCKDKWETGKAATSVESTKQERIMAGLRRQLAPIVTPLCKTIAGNCQRAGRSLPGVVYELS